MHGQRLHDSRPTTATRAAHLQCAKARVVVVFAKKNVGGNKKKAAGAAPVPGSTGRAEAAAVSPAQDAAEEVVVVVVEKQRSAYRQLRKSAEQRAAEKQQQAAELHEARKLPLEAVQSLSRQGNRRVTLVDAYNVIGSWPALASLPTLPEKRRKLEQALAAYALVNKCTIDLVYDSMKAWGQPLSPAPKPSPESRHIIVTFSGMQSADEVLKQHATFWANREGTMETIVVSNDKQVQQDCTRPAANMMALGTPWLRERCADAAKRLRERAQQAAERYMRQPGSARAMLGVASWADALLLPEAKLRAAGLTADRVLDLVAREAASGVAAAPRL